MSDRSSEGDDPSFVDVIGHGTAVMAAIQEKAPDAEYFAVRVFHSSLRTTGGHSAARHRVVSNT